MFFTVLSLVFIPYWNKLFTESSNYKFATKGLKKTVNFEKNYDQLYLSFERSDRQTAVININDKLGKIYRVAAMLCDL